MLDEKLLPRQSHTFKKCDVFVRFRAVHKEERDSSVAPLYRGGFWLNADVFWLNSNLNFTSLLLGVRKDLLLGVCKDLLLGVCKDLQRNVIFKSEYLNNNVF